MTPRRPGRIAGTALAVALLASVAQAGDAARGWQNLRLVVKGSLVLGTLSAEEQAEVAAAAREMRRQEKTAGLTPYEKCRLANLTSDTPGALEAATIDLKCSQR